MPHTRRANGSQDAAPRKLQEAQRGSDRLDDRANGSQDAAPRKLQGARRGAIRKVRTEAGSLPDDTRSGSV